MILTPPAQQKHPDDLFLITREELDRCCNQMSISGYKVSANYVEAMVLSRPHTSTPANPCEEQGCTDIENCDEICEHSRIYSPAWVKQHDTAIRNQLFSELEKLKASTDMGDIIPWCDVEKLRITQQEQP